MKKVFLLVLSISIALTAIAQDDKGKKVKTKFLQLPGYDMSEVDPAAVTAEFVAGQASFGPEKLKDGKTFCKPKGGSVKDVIEITTYYYEVPFNTPASYLIAKDGSGTVVYANKVSEPEKGMAKFGFEKCEYWIVDNMKKDWASGSEKFKSSTISKNESDLLQKAQDIAKANVYPAFVEEEFEVFTAKAKDFEYPELDKAFEDAMLAYEEIANVGPNGKAFDLLKSSIATWEKSLESLEAENKDARINKNVAKGLYENLANAYMYTYQAEKGIKAGIEGKKLYGNFSNNRSIALDARIQEMGTRQIAADRNAAAVADMSKLQEIASNAGIGSVVVKQAPIADFPRIEGEYNAFRGAVYAQKMEASNEMHDKAVAAGEINKYQQYVIDNTTGKMLMMSPLTMAPKLDALPVEICQITDLEQLIIMSNDMESIPSEIGNLTELTKLDLSKNKITEIPVEIGQLSKLKILNLSNNPISSLPEEIKNCSDLKTVNLKGTNISLEEQQKITNWLPDAKIKF